MMGDQRPATRPDILDRLRAPIEYVQIDQVSVPAAGLEDLLEEAGEEIANLRKLLEISTAAVNRLGAEIGVMRGARRDRERKAQ